MTALAPSPHRALRLARFHCACWWLRLGVPLLPLKPHSKHLQPGFGPRQARIVDPSWARRWFLHTDANLAVLLGGSADLIVVDWDDELAYHRWCATLGAGVATLTERTPRGFHLFFFARHFLPAAPPPPAPMEGCELKTAGACAVAPSRHPSGELYRRLHPPPIAPLDPARARSLFPFLSPPPKPLPDVAPHRTPPTTGLLDRIKAARPTLHEMHDAGLVLSPGGPHTLVGRCPFHDDHAPSLWLYPHSGLWGCNRPDCRAAGIHDVINFRAFSRRIRNRAAIRQLADEYL